MSLEIERKYLVCKEYKTLCYASNRMVQGYICRDSGRTVRVRICNGQGYLTIKGASTDNGLSRYEWEHPIPVEEANQLIRLCLPGQIDKTRHLIHHGKHTIEVDEFHGDNEGLVLAEIELDSTDETIELPDFIGTEVTGDRRYYNSYLTEHPYCTWDK